ncbi:phosphate/phosphite/phosphonate ABC transporter substrate-binding protein [Paracoccus gahaiensis]|uniref:Phosphate/phosphite/phosphonate ABC transporter substrate-binding protein n=1 Tax=Paracoccus gahaiensis TaxID=1706839 RepID=A0A4U0R3Y1_9RHOB|nr:phosphate/phosphite/phosphonate ABC transporter substrate-binding protein [Paracoccus gahaiensis]TJZ89495.1 phosphate/phosphite/phosphonate ABC transporter substrate-binding protein [Paracoccus gahaiensis]
MTTKPMTALAFLSALVASASPVHAQSAADVCPASLRMADTGIEGMGGLAEAFGPFGAKFAEVSGVELEMFGLSNRTAAGTALQFDEVDLVFAGPSEFVLFAERQPDIEILFSIARPQYGSSFYVKADSDVQTLADLRGKTVALKDVGSTSGHIFPSQMLVEAGLDIDRDLEIVMAADAQAAVLVNGDVDAMGGGNREMDNIMQLDPEGEYRVIAESGILPGDPIIMRGTLDAECKSALREVLSENSDELWTALIETPRNEDKFLDNDASLSFETTAADYDIVREAYAAAGIDLEQ